MSREMKDSGIEWEKSVPLTWNKCRLKDYYTFEKGKNASVYTKNYNGLHKGIYPVYSGQTENNGIMGQIDTYDYDIQECLFTTTVGAKVMAPKILKGKFSLSQNCLIMRNYTHYKCFNQFIYYLLFPLFDYEKSKIPSYMQPSLRIEDLKTYTFYIPTFTEQQKIASFLDEKTKEIDNTIEKTKETIELYKKYKQAIITEAVTKGLDSNVEMKDSGIEWVGKIPVNWSIRKGKYILNLLNRCIEENSGVVTCFRDGQVTLRENRRTEGFTNAVKEIGYQGVKPGDLVVHGMDGFAGAIGISDSIGKMSPIINVLDSNQNKKYLMYYLRSMAFENVFLATATGIRERSCDLRWNKLANLEYLIPPLSEQQKIADFLDKKCIYIDSLIENKNKLIKKTENYKKSLIYEYVTGKKEVK